MGRIEDEFGEEDLVAPLIYLVEEKGTSVRSVGVAHRGLRACQAGAEGESVGRGRGRAVPRSDTWCVGRRSRQCRSNGAPKVFLRFAEGDSGMVTVEASWRRTTRDKRQETGGQEERSGGANQVLIKNRVQFQVTGRRRGRLQPPGTVPVRRADGINGRYGGIRLEMEISSQSLPIETRHSCHLNLLCTFLKRAKRPVLDFGDRSKDNQRVTPTLPANCPACWCSKSTVVAST